MLRIFFLLSIALTMASPQAAMGQPRDTAGEILTKLDGLPTEKREKALIEGARKEGQLTIYSSTQQAHLTPLTQTFNRKYSFLKVNAFRVSSQRAATKVQMEFRAGRHEVDVINGLPAEAYQIQQIGALDPYDSPERKYFSEVHKDKKGYFTPLFVVPVVLGYNTNFVKRDEAPKSYAELLHPKWKGKMFLDIEDYEWYIVLLKHFGREKGFQYMKQLAQQDLSMRRGRTLQLQLLMAGERGIGIALHAHSVLDFKKKGAPVDWVILDPYFAKPNYVMLAKYARHPHAAALFIDWALSNEGQLFVTTFGRVVARKGVNQHFPQLVEKEFILADAETIGPVLNNAAQEFNQIFVPWR